MTAARRSRAWSRAQSADPYVQRARAGGYRSRAAFKLMEIDDRDALLGSGARVLDLGAAPGGWSQLAAERTGANAGGVRGQVIAVDRLELAPIVGVNAVQADIATDAALAAIASALGGRPADVVLSDMAPDLTGVKVADQAAAAGLWTLALDVAERHLRRGGTLLVKVFEGGESASYRRLLATRFERVASRKPAASRSRSAEHYLLARGFRRDAREPRE